MRLEHKVSELEDRHPASGRYMDNANDLDMVLSDGVGPNSPPGIGPATTCHALLRNLINEGHTQKH
jgi:hypothetical protein